MSRQLKIKTIANNELSLTEYAQIILLCSQSFEEDYAPYLNLFEDPIHVLGILDGEIVSQAIWITRWLQIGNGPLLRTAYVEGVATNEIYRGCGYATAVMQHLAKEIAYYEIGALSPAETTLYINLGWQYWQGPLFHRKSEQLIRDPEDESMMILRTPKTPELNLSLPISIEWREGEVW